MHSIKFALIVAIVGLIPCIAVSQNIQLSKPSNAGEEPDHLDKGKISIFLEGESPVLLPFIEKTLKELTYANSSQRLFNENEVININFLQDFRDYSYARTDLVGFLTRRTSIQTKTSKSIRDTLAKMLEDVNYNLFVKANQVGQLIEYQFFLYQVRVEKREHSKKEWLIQDFIPDSNSRYSTCIVDLVRGDYQFQIRSAIMKLFEKEVNTTPRTYVTASGFDLCDSPNSKHQSDTVFKRIEVAMHDTIIFKARAFDGETSASNLLIEWNMEGDENDIIFLPNDRVNKAIAVFRDTGMYYLWVRCFDGITYSQPISIEAKVLNKAKRLYTENSSTRRKRTVKPVFGSIVDNIWQRKKQPIISEEILLGKAVNLNDITFEISTKQQEEDFQVQYRSSPVDEKSRKSLDKLFVKQLDSIGTLLDDSLVSMIQYDSLFDSLQNRYFTDQRPFWVFVTKSDTSTKVNLSIDNNRANSGEWKVSTWESRNCYLSGYQPIEHDFEVQNFSMFYLESMWANFRVRAPGNINNPIVNSPDYGDVAASTLVLSIGVNLTDYLSIGLQNMFDHDHFSNNVSANPFTVGLDETVGLFLDVNLPLQEKTNWLSKWRLGVGVSSQILSTTTFLPPDPVDSNYYYIFGYDRHLGFRGHIGYVISQSKWGSFDFTFRGVYGAGLIFTPTPRKRAQMSMISYGISWRPYFRKPIF